MKTGCTLIFRKKVMISGHFDGFHSGHLDYLKQAIEYGDIICIISSDRQLLMKKGRANMCEKERLRILDAILIGMKGCHYSIYSNIWDTKTTLVAEALRHFRPTVFFRGYDKELETMPKEERKVCEELGIEIIHAKNRIGERHSSEIFE